MTTNEVECNFEWMFPLEYQFIRPADIPQPSHLHDSARPEIFSKISLFLVFFMFQTKPSEVVNKPSLTVKTVKHLINSLVALIGTLVQNLYFIQLTLNIFPMILNESWTWKMNDNGLLTLRSAKSLSSATLTSPIFIVNLEPAQQRSRSKKILSKDQRNKETRPDSSWGVTLAITVNCTNQYLEGQAWSYPMWLLPQGSSKSNCFVFLLRITPKPVTQGAPFGIIRTKNVTFRQNVSF